MVKAEAGAVAALMMDAAACVPPRAPRAALSEVDALRREIERQRRAFLVAFRILQHEALGKEQASRFLRFIMEERTCENAVEAASYFLVGDL